MDNAVFGKNTKNTRKHRDINLFTIERRRNYLVSKVNHHTTKFLHRKRISNRNEKSRDTYK